ncbi:hypothetical protein G6F57_011424 [Rhizopus arrhizus]|uniref:C2H2-type domain-containing protein n=1 Tax=Rhizopus oryzae TaxID=64495 RepID=A0A9P6WZW0_RHIOR|nr:hypothetical protein G6F24_011261 [Rhizopus arrhizus]KAG1410272.1 hypothetical protein G6F58_009241 [Rhizopus delemar]KAG0782447.1 hypothetical protein G6F21_011107 [Rhizopus arrhizus]KAG0783708.1 hypothetical protein G6F22_008576 [Rhizopus arrhizus]KAG0806118.1 hypothetical protein G6F20_011379 [Rhizopus arrhizus]
MSEENVFEILMGQLMQMPETDVYSDDYTGAFLPLTNGFQMYKEDDMYQGFTEMLPALIQDAPYQAGAESLKLNSSFSSSTSNSSVLTEPSSYDPTLSWTTSSAYPYFESLNSQPNLSSILPHFESLTISQAPYAENKYMTRPQTHQQHPRTKLHGVKNRAGDTLVSPSVTHPETVKNKPKQSLKRPFRLTSENAEDTQKKKKSRNQTVEKTERKYPCSICGRSFKRPQEQARHQVCHTGERSFLCDYPGCQSKGFSRKDALTRHMKCHTALRCHVKKEEQKVRKLVKPGTTCRKEQSPPKKPMRFGHY